MRMVDLIIKKRNGEELTKEELHFFISKYTSGEIPDYQASALLMAIVFRGMKEEEIANLTHEMEYSGSRLDLSKIKGVKCDKHSTGGVGDKTSLVVGPIVAACGANVVKLSGRGLGHTGGTIDKLESIPGFNISMDEKDFIDQVDRIGVAIIGQTKTINPADKKLYALRDVTGTVESIPLIASSIMSKKLAGGADTIILDVKVGEGAFMKTYEDAAKLSLEMVKIGKALNRDTRAMLTNMNSPLGLAVGNSLEVVEAINTLKGKGPKDFTKLCLTACSIMLVQAKIAKTKEEGYIMAEEAIKSGRGLERFKMMVKEQGGDVGYIEHPEKFPTCKYVIEVKAESYGYVHGIHALTIGECAMRLGAGRETLNDIIDHAAGIVLNKKPGDYVKEGDLLATCYTNKENVCDVIKDIASAFDIKKDVYNEPDIILGTIE